MKKLLILIVISLSISACQKDGTLPENDIPQWLKDRIAHDEMIIETDPQSGLDIAAWIRYKYEKEYYFEYHNLLSSAGPETYSITGTEYHPSDYLDYKDNRCCKVLVWKGPNYIGE